jgi:hypothetical protein
MGPWQVLGMVIVLVPEMGLILEMVFVLEQQLDVELDLVLSVKLGSRMVLPQKGKLDL